MQDIRHLITFWQNVAFLHPCSIFAGSFTRFNAQICEMPGTESCIISCCHDLHVLDFSVWTFSSHQVVVCRTKQGGVHRPCLTCIPMLASNKILAWLLGPFCMSMADYLHHHREAHVVIDLGANDLPCS